MWRNILAVIAGFVGGGILVMLFEALGHLIYPVPEWLDMSKPETIAEYAKNLPVGALLAVLVAQSAGSFGGGLITGLIAVSKKQTVALVYGILALIMVLINLFIVPHPLWFVIVSIVLPIPLALLGSRVVSRESPSV